MQAAFTGLNETIADLNTQLGKLRTVLDAIEAHDAGEARMQRLFELSQAAGAGRARVEAG